MLGRRVPRVALTVVLLTVLVWQVPQLLQQTATVVDVIAPDDSFAFSYPSTIHIDDVRSVPPRLHPTAAATVKPTTATVKPTAQPIVKPTVAPATVPVPNVDAASMRKYKFGLWQPETLAYYQELALSGASHPLFEAVKVGYKTSKSRYDINGPFSPTNKTYMPDSGDLRDFMSFVPYAWPCDDFPEEKCTYYGGKPHNMTKIHATCRADGKPWLICDGQFNRKAIAMLDFERFQRVTEICTWASLQALLFNDEGAADMVVTQVKVWFIKEETAMLPRLLYSQIIPGSDNPGRANGSKDNVIDFYSMPYVIEAVTLLQDRFSPDELQRLAKWFRDFLDHIREKEVRELHEKHAGNHGIWYDVVVMSMALWLEDYNIVREVAEKAKQLRIARYINAEGDMPHETGRPASAYYFSYTLDPFGVVAHYASAVGVDLWNWEAENGASITKAFAFALKYATRSMNNAWPYENHGHALKFYIMQRPLRLGTMAYKDVALLRAIDELIDVNHQSSDISLLCSPVHVARKAPYAFVYGLRLTGANEDAERICSLAASARALRTAIGQTDKSAAVDLVVLMDPEEEKRLGERERTLLIKEVGLVVLPSKALGVYNASAASCNEAGRFPASLEFAHQLELPCLPYDAVQLLATTDYVTEYNPTLWAGVADDACRCVSAPKTAVSRWVRSLLFKPSIASCLSARSQGEAACSMDSFFENECHKLGKVMDDTEKAFGGDLRLVQYDAKQPPWRSPTGDDGRAFNSARDESIRHLPSYEAICGNVLNVR